MVACLSPTDNNYDETLSTLRYANRAKNIYNEPHVNEDPKDTMLRQYQEQIKKLKEMLDASTAQLPASNGVNDISEKEKLRLEYQDEMAKLRAKYQEEYDSKCQMQADLKSLKEKYDKNLAKISNQVRKQRILRQNVFRGYKRDFYIKNTNYERRHLFKCIIFSPSHF